MRSGSPLEAGSGYSAANQRKDEVPDDGVGDTDDEDEAYTGPKTGIIAGDSPEH